MDVSRFYRQLKMMLGIGRVTAMEDDGLTQTLQCRTPLDVISVRRLTEFGFSSAPPVGSDALIASLGGDRSSPIVIATNHKSSRHGGLKAGETVIFDQSGLYVKLTASGIQVEAKGQPVTISNATTVTITGTDKVIADTPRFECTGDIIDNTGSNSATLKQLRDAYDGHTHKVSGVDTGSGSVTSDKTGSSV